MKLTMHMLVILAAAALAGCCDRPARTSVQMSQPMALHDFYQPAYDYSGSVVPAQSSGTAGVAVK